MIDLFLTVVWPALKILLWMALVGSTLAVAFRALPAKD